MMPSTSRLLSGPSGKRVADDVAEPGGAGVDRVHHRRGPGIDRLEDQEHHHRRAPAARAPDAAASDRARRRSPRCGAASSPRATAGGGFRRAALGVAVGQRSIVGGVRLRPAIASSIVDQRLARRCGARRPSRTTGTPSSRSSASQVDCRCRGAAPRPSCSPRAPSAGPARALPARSAGAGAGWWHRPRRRARRAPVRRDRSRGTDRA